MATGSVTQPSSIVSAFWLNSDNSLSVSLFLSPGLVVSSASLCCVLYYGQANCVVNEDF